MADKAYKIEKGFKRMTVNKVLEKTGLRPGELAKMCGTLPANVRWWRKNFYADYSAATGEIKIVVPESVKYSCNLSDGVDK